MIKVLISFIDGTWEASKYHRYLERVPPWVRSRIRRYKNLNDAVRSLIGKLLLQHGLQKFNVRYELDDLRFTSYDRPSFNDPSFDFNISHSDKIVVCAFCFNGRVGVDVEKIHPVNLRDFESVLSDKERRLVIESLGHDTFFRFWTRKEAIVKANGKGINIALDNIDTTQPITILEDELWFVEEVSMGSEYVLHIASDQRIRGIDKQTIWFD